jgi:hypothetical protein
MTARIAFAVCPSNELLNPFNPNCDSSGYNSILYVMQPLLNLIFLVAIPLTTIMTLYGGFLLLTSAGDPAKVANGKSAVVWALIGFAIVLLSGGISLLIKNALGS